MKPKRLLLCAACVAACIALVLVLLATLDARTGITKANYDRIQPGMTLTEVQDVFGKVGICETGTTQGAPQVCVYSWENQDRSGAFLLFDNNRLLMKGQWTDSTESMWDKILRLIHWPWWK
jgi:hypothetical protein